MIHEEFETMLLAAYGNQEIPADQKAELRLCFARGVMLGHVATWEAAKHSTKKKNVVAALLTEIASELRAASGEGPAIVLEPITLKIVTDEEP